MKSIISIITHITGKKRALEQIHSTRFCAEGGPIMNVHTFELSTVVDYKIYLELAKLSYPDKRNEHRRICDRLTAYGLWITLYKSKKQYKFWETYHVYYRINPHRLFEQGDYLGLHRANELISTISEINHKLAEVSEYFPQIELCKLVRCDFCVNTTAPSKEFVEGVIEISNRSFTSVISKNYEQKKDYNRKANRYSLPKHEATFSKSYSTGQKAVEVSIYDKAWQLQQFKTPQAVDTNILRCEMRCFRPYIKRLGKKFGCDDVIGFFLKAEEIGNYVFKWQLRKLGLDKDFARLPAITAAIEQSNYKDKTRRELVETALEAARHRSLAVSLSGLPIDEAKKQMKKFGKLGISPMPIPHNAVIPNFFNFCEWVMEFARY